MVNIIEIYNKSDYIKTVKNNKILCSRLQQEIDKLIKVLEDKKNDRYNKTL